jgi:hypothetical protein
VPDISATKRKIKPQQDIGPANHGTRGIHMRKLILFLLTSLLLTGCLIEEKKYYGCGDAKCCASDEDLDVKAHDDAVEDAEKDFADLFEEVTDTK